MNIFFTDRAPAQKARRLVIQLLARFLVNAAPLLGRGLDQFQFNHLFDHRQMIGQTGRTGFARLNFDLIFWWDDDHWFCGRGTGGQLQQL